MSVVDLLLLASGPVLYTWLAVILGYRRVYSRFPVFFAYNIYAVLATSARLAVSSNGFAYFYVFWWTELGFLLLSIAALHESFRSVFEGFYLVQWFRWFYFGGIVLVVTVSIVNSIFNRPVQVHPLLRIILDVGIPINCILAAIFGLFYASAKL